MKTQWFPGASTPPAPQPLLASDTSPLLASDGSTIQTAR